VGRTATVRGAVARASTISPMETSIVRSGIRRRRSARAVWLRRAAVAVALLLALVLAASLAFAGSQTTLANGTTIAGLDVGGMAPAEARSELAARFAAVRDDAQTFRAGDLSYAFSAGELGVRPDWAAAVAVGEEPVDAALRRRGLRVRVVPGQPGRALERSSASAVIVDRLASFARGGAVSLPVVATRPDVTSDKLAAAAANARQALAAPLRLAYRETRWRISRAQVAKLLVLPTDGATEVTVGGPAADRWLRKLERIVNVKPRDARFAIDAKREVYLVSSREGRALEVDVTRNAIAKALFSPTNRLAPLSVAVAAPARSTTQAEAMGIEETVGTYTTLYGGTEGRLHNVALAAKLIDGTLLAPGKIFSFNGTTGERTPEKGFTEAPVIVGNELVNGIAGGVCQVSTTVFNAVYEAGLPIEERWNHALFISHYPQGRDATVDFPGLDLKFRNDTGKWVLLRTFVTPGRLTVTLYGTSPHRRVETEVGPLVVTGAVPIKKIKDPKMPKGTHVTEAIGTPPRATSVHRTVFDENGKLLFETRWRSTYVAEDSVVRIGTKKKAKPKPKPDPELGPALPGVPGVDGATDGLPPADGAPQDPDAGLVDPLAPSA
jgi:vancomycin resistance protein YoaR